jgi:hypothetical protein
MIIEWRDSQKEVPGVGVLVEGNKYTVRDDIAENLIKQGQAKEVKEKVTTTASKGAKK